MSEERLEKLPTEISDFIRASSLVSTTNVAVEELILNSIDAGASSIEIFVNMKKFNIEVVDNGVGLTLDELKHCGTSRNLYYNQRIDQKNPKCYGSKGEALVSISSLSKLKITSRSKKSSITYSKNCFTNKITKLPNVSMHGTSVIIEDLFYNIPVRRKSTRANIEIFKIKNLVQKLSILLHNISWVFIERSSNKLICRYNPVMSVAQRFSLLHTPIIVNKMKEVQYTYGNFTLVGLLSPPHPVNCHCTKEYQYFYINNRYIKLLDIITKVIDNIFLSLVSLSKSYGPAKKHSDSGNSQSICHPCFVLQLVCPPKEYEVLWENSDTHTVIFRKSKELSLCLFKLLHSWFSTYRPEIVPSLGKAYYDASISCGNTHHKLFGQQKHFMSDITETETEILCNSDDNFHQPNINNINTTNNSKENSSPFSPHAINMLPTSPSTNQRLLRTTPTLTSTTINSMSSEEYPSPVSFTSAFLSSPEEKFSESLRPFHSQYYESESSLLEQINSQKTRSGSSPFGVTVHRSPCLLEDYFDAKYNSPPHDDSVSQLNDSWGEDNINTSHHEETSRSSSEGTMKNANRKRQREEAGLRVRPKFQKNNYYSDIIDDSSQFKQLNGNRRSGNIISNEIDSEYYQMISIDKSNKNQKYSLDSKPVNNQINSIKNTEHVIEDRNIKYSGRGKNIEGDSNCYPIDYESSLSHDNADNNLISMMDTEKSSERNIVNNLIDSSSNSSSSSNSDSNSNGNSSSNNSESNRSSDNFIDARSARIQSYSNINSSKSDKNDFSGILSFDSFDGDEDSNSDIKSDNKSNKLLQRKVWFPPIPRLKVDASPSGLGMRLGREVFEDIQVIGQASRSFIICHKIDGAMLCVDQHAADERIQVEQLEKASLQFDDVANITYPNTNKSKASPTVTVKLEDNDYSSLEQFRPIMKRWGFSYELKPLSGTSKHLLYVHRLPIVATESLTVSDLLEFARFIVSHLYLPETLLRPPAFRRILASRACHNAVRFGDNLAINKCQLIIKKLSNTEFPFQCAHGRPSVIPLIQLDDLNRPSIFLASKLFAKPDYQNILENHY